MSGQPFFSVVIPTRNRARLVTYALQSALEQTFQDYEIIVSNNYSQDHTEQVVNDFAGPKVRYVKTDRVMSMPDHWEFALDQARGRYVTYLCDDDAFAPTALARVADLLSLSRSQLVVLYSGLYFAPNWLDPKMRNVATFAPFTGEVREHESSRTVRELYGSCRVVSELPRMLNTFCERETIARVRQAAGRIFLLCPDYSFAAMILTEIPSWLYIDEPLQLQGVFPEGIGSTQIFNRGEAASEFVREFGDKRLLERVPLQCKVVSNYIAETLLLCQERLPALAAYHIDWLEYFLTCWNDILTLEQNGVDVSTDRELFTLALADQPSAVRQRVELETGCAVGGDPWEAWTRRHPIRATMRKVVDSSPLLANVESILRGRKRNGSRPPSNTILSGTELGFNNILDCARRLPQLAISSSASRPLWDAASADSRT